MGGSTLSEVLLFYVCQVSCKILAVLVHYTSTSNYFWMLCEGIYLHTLIIVAVFVGEQQLFWYHVLGWGESGGSDILPASPRLFHFVLSTGCFYLVVMSITTTCMPIIALISNN